MSFDGYGDVFLGSVFFGHSYEDGKYVSSRREQLAWDRATDGHHWLRASVTGDNAKELVAIHDDFQFSVMTPTCPAQ
jgi:hypothetical protein